MSRYYHIEYWNNASSLIKEDVSGRSYSQTYNDLDQQGFKILSIKFIGWR